MHYNIDYEYIYNALYKGFKLSVTITFYWLWNLMVSIKSVIKLAVNWSR